MGRAAAAFSFYPGKNLGACGEAGAATTNDAHIGRRPSKCCATMDKPEKYYHDVEGYNGRLDALAGRSVCTLKLDSSRRTGTSSARQRCRATIADLLDDAEQRRHGSRSSLHGRKAGLPPLCCAAARIAEGLHGSSQGQPGIGIGYSLSDTSASAEGLSHHCGYQRWAIFRSRSAWHAEIVSLPMFPQLTAEQQERVVEAVMTFAEAATEQAA